MTSTQLDDEIVVLQSIYGTAFEELRDETPPSSSSVDQRRIVHYKDDFCAITLSVPVSYPTYDESHVPIKVVSVSFHDNDHRVSIDEVLRQLEEIIAANAGKETLFDLCEYLRGKSYIEENDSGGIVVSEESVVSVIDCPEGKIEATDTDVEHPLPTTVFQGSSASENFAAACAAANAAAEKAAAERRATTSKARENQMNYPHPGETSKAYYSRQERHWMALAVATMDAESDSDDELTDREKERRDKKRALALKKKAKELAEVAFVEATAAAATTSSLPVK